MVQRKDKMKGYRELICLMRQIPEVREILDHELFLSMENYRHHGNISCLEHTLIVACNAYLMALQYGADLTATVRAALLHDFYLYDWHTGGPGLHGFRHPAIALRNARDHFKLSPVEENAILRHMWPLTPTPPRYRESYIVCLADKGAAISDYSRLVTKKQIVETGIFHPEGI